MWCRVNELGADVNQADKDGVTPLHVAAEEVNFDMVRCLVKFGADIDPTDCEGDTPLINAARGMHADLAKWFVKAGADPQTVGIQSTAAEVSRLVGASPEQTAYLEAQAHCAHPGCSGAGTKKCQGCMQRRYCGPACHLAHLPVHKAECRRLGAALESAQSASSV